MGGHASLMDGTLAPEVSAYGFRKCNDLIDVMATEMLAIYREQRVGPFSVTSGQGDITASAPITIGVGATWNTARPVFINRAGVIYTAGSTPRPELKMHVFTIKEWSEVTTKGVTSTLSRALIYDRLFNSSSYGNIYLYPVPSASFQVVLYLPVALTEFPLDASGNPDFTTVIALPPAYRLMLISHLARLMSIGTVAVSDDLKELCTETMAKVKASNVITHMDALSCDAATLQSQNQGGSWDWISGGFE